MNRPREYSYIYVCVSVCVIICICTYIYIYVHIYVHIYKYVQSCSSESHIYIYGASLVTQVVKNLPEMWEIRVQSLGQKDLLEKGMAIHCSILA